MERSKRIWLNFLVLWVVMVVVFIIILFRDYEYNIVTSPQKIQKSSPLFSKKLVNPPSSFYAFLLKMNLQTWN